MKKSFFSFFVVLYMRTLYSENVIVIITSIVKSKSSYLKASYPDGKRGRLYLKMC